MAGLHWFWAWAASARSAGWRRKLSPHVHERVAHKSDSVGGIIDLQVDTALQSILSGGWFGRGPAKASISAFCPTPTDFVFAVTGEMIACLALIAFFGFIVIRGLWLALVTRIRSAVSPPR